MTKWAIELADHDLNFLPRTAIKGQIIADFLVEVVHFENPVDPMPELWNLFVVGASNQEGAGAGLLMVSPKGEEFSYALRFEFQATNNEAEYEALIAGLNLAHNLGVQKLKVHNDSQFVVNQIKGEYEAKEDAMQRYLAKVKRLWHVFEDIEIIQILFGPNNV